MMFILFTKINKNIMTMERTSKRGLLRAKTHTKNWKIFLKSYINIKRLYGRVFLKYCWKEKSFKSHRDPSYVFNRKKYHLNWVYLKMVFYRKDTYKYRGLAHRGEAPPQVPNKMFLNLHTTSDWCGVEKLLAFSISLSRGWSIHKAADSKEHVIS